MSTNKIAIAGLMTAITCIFGPISITIPFSPVPVSLGLFGILLTTVLLGAKLGTLSCTLYILLGLAGLPVFSGFTSGIGVLLGPTGGYLLGYPAVTASYSLFTGNKKPSHLLHGAGIACGLMVCYLFGSLWLAHFLDLSFGNALLIGVLPYLPTDIIKVCMALWLGTHLRKRLRKANLL